MGSKKSFSLFTSLFTLHSVSGYSQTPLLKKLGIKPGIKLHVHGEPADYFDLLGPLPDNVSVTTTMRGPLDFIHLFVNDKASFEKEFVKAAKLLASDGMIWISWPKKSARMSTNLDENIIREFGLKVGLVDVKVCAVDEIWSGLKFVIRLKDRKK